MAGRWATELAEYREVVDAARIRATEADKAAAEAQALWRQREAEAEGAHRFLDKLEARVADVRRRALDEAAEAQRLQEDLAQPNVTLLDVVQHFVGVKDTYTGADFERAGVPMIPGCEVCGATVGPWDACPTQTGYVRCGGCVSGSGLGFKSVAAFLAFSAAQDHESGVKE